MTPRQTTEQIGALAGVTPVLAAYTARILRAATDAKGKRLGLWPQPGKGARRASYTSSQMVNLLLALAGEESSRGPEVVTEFRSLRCDAKYPRLRGSTLGEHLDCMLEMLAIENLTPYVREPMRSTQILLMLKPSRAAVIIIPVGDGYQQTLSYGELPASTSILYRHIPGQSLESLSMIWRKHSTPHNE